MQSIIRGIVQHVVALGQKVLLNFQRVPIYFWVYLAIVGYIYKRMLREFLGIGTKNCRIIGRVTLALSREEELLSSSVIDPANLQDTFETVGGLAEVKAALTESVVWPYRHPDLLASAGVGGALPTGVLLYGPPGTGKTLLARALAKELNCYFIDVSVDKLFSKYVGESEKLAAAVFSLAHKLRDCVIFIDEIDALLSSRGAGNSDSDGPAVYTHAKTIFMTKWDGLATAAQQQARGADGAPGKVLVLGATNRMDVLDDAILRRLSVRLEVPLPCREARESILRIQLAGINAILLDDAAAAQEVQARQVQGAEYKPLVVSASDVVSDVSRDLVYYTGSDIRELCKAALMISFRGKVQALRQAAAAGGALSPSPSASPTNRRDTRSTTTNSLMAAAPSIIRLTDMKQAMARVHPSGAPQTAASGAHLADPVHRYLMRVAATGSSRKNGH
jgi:SpoVK/Ycf46/Vps4 family AAA+-type ATPase